MAGETDLDMAYRLGYIQENILLWVEGYYYCEETTPVEQAWQGKGCAITRKKSDQFTTASRSLLLRTQGTPWMAFWVIVIENWSPEKRIIAECHPFTSHTILVTPVHKSY